MDELVPRDDKRAIEREKQEVALPELSRAIAELHLGATRATKRAAEQIYNEAAGIETPTVFEWVGPFARANAEQAGNIYHQIAKETSLEMWRTYKDFGSKRD